MEAMTLLNVIYLHLQYFLCIFVKGSIEHKDLYKSVAFKRNWNIWPQQGLYHQKGDPFDDEVVVVVSILKVEVASEKV